MIIKHMHWMCYIYMCTKGQDFMNRCNTAVHHFFKTNIYVNIIFNFTYT